MEATDFWDKPDKARATVGQLKALNALLEPVDEVAERFGDARVAYDMSRETGDKDFLTEADEQLWNLAKEGGEMEKVELRSLLVGKYDHGDCFLTISGGAGGTEANDWADMLLRMYIFYCEKMGFSMEEVEKTPGTQVGIDSVTLHIKGDYAYGYLNCERGTHRLARVSPFNAEGKRQTSFSTVDVTPEIEETTVEVPDRDLEIIGFVRAAGPGGQNVNKVATAIRVIHKPTGIMVVTNTYKDQSQNRKQALAILFAKLQQIEDDKRAKELNEATGGAVERGWGTQIRSYVFYDNRVKDHRTNTESTDYERVLRGEIQPFIDAELQRRRKEKSEARVGGTPVS